MKIKLTSWILFLVVKESIVKGKVIFILVVVVLLLSILISGCEKSTTTITTAKSTSTQATTQSSATTSLAQTNWWDKFGTPQYGGTIILRISGYMPNFDTWTLPGGEKELWLESLFEQDWTLDRNIWNFNEGLTPDEYVAGHLAEKWEWTNPTTLTVHIRQGVCWQNIEPVNGREFTAYDIQSHYERVMGKGAYTEAAPMWAPLFFNWDSVTATDKYTVVFKFKKQAALTFQNVTDMSGANCFEAPEVAKLAPSGGNVDPEYAIGTGPWMLAEYLSGTSLTFNKNPNYWGTDPRYPQNKLPYADTLKMLIISDTSTATAALRTGKVDIIAEQAYNWQQVAVLKKDITDLHISKTLVGAQVVGPRMDAKPFTDINVRKALQMAIDRKTIASSYYGGSVDGTPCGWVSPAMKGFAYEYVDWPQSLKDEYSYNPTKAKELLAQAGFPDGVKTNVVISSIRNDSNLMQLIKSEFMDIGVDMEIRVMEDAAWESFLSAGKQDQMVGNVAAMPAPPSITITGFYSKDPRNWAKTNDPTYDAIVDKYNAAATMVEASQLRVEADKYTIEQHWGIIVCPYVMYDVWQPYLKGYSGETISWGQSSYWARFWIDQTSK
jgi:peptide/nickel transport system substrate-binding protein